MKCYQDRPLPKIQNPSTIPYLGSLNQLPKWASRTLQLKVDATCFQRAEKENLFPAFRSSDLNFEGDISDCGVYEMLRCNIAIRAFHVSIAVARGPIGMSCCRAVWPRLSTALLTSRILLTRAGTIRRAVLQRTRNRGGGRGGDRGTGGACPRQHYDDSF